MIPTKPADFESTFLQAIGIAPAAVPWKLRQTEPISCAPTDDRPRVTFAAILRDHVPNVGEFVSNGFRCAAPSPSMAIGEGVVLPVRHFAPRFRDLARHDVVLFASMTFGARLVLEIGEIREISTTARRWQLAVTPRLGRTLRQRLGVSHPIPLTRMGYHWIYAGDIDKASDNRHAAVRGCVIASLSLAAAHR